MFITVQAGQPVGVVIGIQGRGGVELGQAGHPAGIVVDIGGGLCQPVDGNGFEPVHGVVGVADRLVAGIGDLGDVAVGVAGIGDAEAARIGGACQAIDRVIGVGGGPKGVLHLGEVIVLVIGIGHRCSILVGHGVGLAGRGVGEGGGPAFAVGDGARRTVGVIGEAHGLAQGIGGTGEETALVVDKGGFGSHLIGQRTHPAHRVVGILNGRGGGGLAAGRVAPAVLLGLG